MAGGVKVPGRMSVRRVVATPHVAACAAETEVKPAIACLQTLLATEGTRYDSADAGKMRAEERRHIRPPRPGRDEGDASARRNAP